MSENCYPGSFSSEAPLYPESLWDTEPLCLGFLILISSHHVTNAKPAIQAAPLGEALSASISVHVHCAECNLANLPDALSREEHTAPSHYHHHGRSIPQAAVGTCPVLLSLNWSRLPSDRGNSDAQSWLTTSGAVLLEQKQNQRSHLVGKMLYFSVPIRHNWKP